MQYFTPGGTASNVQIVAEKYHWVVFAWKELLYVFNIKRLFPITGYSSVGTVIWIRQQKFTYEFANL